MENTVSTLERIKVDQVYIEGMLELPPDARGIVLFAHGSGSSRHSTRNNYVAKVLQNHGIGTLFIDLLTTEEDVSNATRFDIPLLAHRLISVTSWLKNEPKTQKLPIAYFGASTGAAAAIQAAARLSDEIVAVVSRGGRPDLAGLDAMETLRAPTLLLVGEWDSEVISLNRLAYGYMRCTNELQTIPGATHLFSEPGTLEEVALQATIWFERYLKIT